MNSEQLICQAGTAIAEFIKHYNTSCLLYIKYGNVCCKSIPLYPKICESRLLITQWEAINGLTKNAWDCIGTELLNQYNKEKLCQAHQKP